MKAKILSALLLVCITPSAFAYEDVTSREYKMMLNPSNFTYGNESTQVSQLASTFKTQVSSATGRSVTGHLSFNKSREVQFFDTPSTCLLSNNGYAFRERVEGGQSEVTLKFRSADRYISAYEDLDSVTSGAEEKLEADVGANAQIPYKVVYGHSNTVPNSRTINDMKDINTHFVDFKRDYGFSNKKGLSAVGGLRINERVFKGLQIDLGSIDADVSVTLWYDNDSPSPTSHPVVAEMSFKYKDSNAQYSKKVVNRAKIAFDALRNMNNWIDADSTTKTRFVYQYNPHFCL